MVDHLAHRRLGGPDDHVAGLWAVDMDECGRAPTVELEACPQHRLDQHERKRQLAIFAFVDPAERRRRDANCDLFSDNRRGSSRGALVRKGIIPASWACVRAPSTNNDLG